MRPHNIAVMIARIRGGGGSAAERDQHRNLASRRARDIDDGNIYGYLWSRADSQENLNINRRSLPSNGNAYYSLIKTDSRPAGICADRHE